MELADCRVVVTGAGRGLGRTLAICFAQLGAEVFLSSRDLASSEKVCADIQSRGKYRVHAHECDLNQPSSIGRFAQAVGAQADSIDVLINNGARWLEPADIENSSDDEIVSTITSGTVGMVLMVKHFRALLRCSSRPDIVNIISSAGLSNEFHANGSPAFYASKGGQARAAQLLSHRLKDEGIRVISLYPPDFQNIDPYNPQWAAASRTTKDTLTSQSIVECVLFAVRQPRDCSIRSFEFAF